jgi:GTP-binding protein
LKREWQELLWHYITNRTTLIALVVVVDARHGMADRDYALLDGFVPSGRPALILATKTDKLNLAARREAIAAIRRGIDERFGAQANSVTVQLFSAVSRDGVEGADAVIEAWLPPIRT